MEELTHTLYPIVFEHGTFGSSLGHFIAFHDGFYPFTHCPVFSRDGHLSHNYEAIPNLKHTISEINEYFKDIDTSKKMVCKFDGNSAEIPDEVIKHVGTKVFPVVIKNDPNAVKMINMVHEIYERYTIEKKEFKASNKIILNNIVNNPEYEEGVDYFITNVLYYYKLIQDESFYDSLCQFLNTTKRPTVKKDVHNIIKLDKYNIVSRHVTDEFGLDFGVL